MKHDIYTKFGNCWNSADFGGFSNKISKVCTYTSFDYFYKLKGREKIVDLLNGQAKINMSRGSDDVIDIYTGFYQQTNSVLKTIKECCIMVRRRDLKSVRILVFGKKMWKIISITGIDPGEVKTIRNTKI